MTRRRLSKTAAIPVLNGRSAAVRNVFPLVALGASAGGLAALGTLLESLPAGSGAAFIVVQHLDPAQESLLPSLLADHTGMAVHEATDGLSILAENLYVIPPGRYLAVR